MTPHRPRTFGLFAAGLTLLLVGSWILQVTLPPRNASPLHGRMSVRKMVRVGPAPRPLGRDQKRSESAHDLVPVVWTVHDFPVRDAAG